MGKYEFIKELSNRRKVRFFFTTVLSLFVIGAIGFTFFTLFKEGISQSLSFNFIKDFFNNEIKKLTPLGLFYLSFFGNLMLIPLPIEAPFFLGLMKGNLFLPSLFFVLAGLIPSQAINYIVGKKFSKAFFTLFSTKKIYKAKRWVNKYGSYAIFGFNLLPLPSNEITFGLGIAKYNVTRLFVFTLLGTIIKFFAMWGFYLLFF